MDPNFSTAPLWSYGLAAISHLALVVHLLRGQRGNRGDPVIVALVVAVAASAAWAAAGFVLALAPGVRFVPLQVVLDIVRYGAWHGFAFLLLYPATSRNRPVWPVVVLGAIACAGLASQAAIVFSEFPMAAAVRGGRYAALAQVVFGLAMIEQLFRNTTEDSRWKIKPMGIGLAAVFVFDLYFHSTTLLFNRVDDDAFTVRGFAYALVLPLIVLSISRFRARRLQVTLSQTAVFQTTALVTAGFYLLVASAAGYYVRYLGGSWGGALQLAVLFAALVLLMLLALSGTMRSRLKVLVGKHFFRYRYDYREEWLKFTRAMSAEDDSRHVGQQVIRGLADMVESPGGVLWMRDAGGLQFSQVARWNLPVSEATESSDSPMPAFLQNSGWVLNLEEFRYLPGRYHGLALPAWLSDIPNAWLVVPLGTAGGIVGFVVLTTARTPLDVNWEVNDLLRTAGRQAAIFLAQMQATEALLEARKFESFNRMSAFVVHDLKNIVTQLSLMLRNAERHAGNAEFQRDMLLTVHHSVDRMKQLMLQLREGTTPVDGSCGVGLDGVARRVQTSKATQSPPVELDIREAAVARGHEDRIERVIGHLVQNALDATPPDGRVWITVGREGGMALVEVGDTGHGMSAEFIRERLFKPFQTTKHAGMGIGAYESRQYIQELGGDIRVESAENAGTLFRVRLPLIEVRKTSDLKQPEMT
ncbi:MAG: PEP-CTERM system histidine kinase PrsK [Rhodocyclaceae bacterium]|nr:PEP-CTERM system histidine kinase PrsK [Rhodocyclaceae bacterium]